MIQWNAMIEAYLGVYYIKENPQWIYRKRWKSAGFMSTYCAVSAGKLNK